jgi:hypothetical protein
MTARAALRQGSGVASSILSRRSDPSTAQRAASAAPAIHDMLIQPLSLVSETTPASLRVASPQQGDFAKPDCESIETTVRQNSPARTHQRTKGSKIDPQLIGGQPGARTESAGAKFLNCAQLIVTRNWQSAFRDETLGCGASIPDRNPSK